MAVVGCGTVHVLTRGLEVRHSSECSSNLSPSSCDTRYSHASISTPSRGSVRGRPETNIRPTPNPPVINTHRFRSDLHSAHAQSDRGECLYLVSVTDTLGPLQSRCVVSCPVSVDAWVRSGLSSYITSCPTPRGSRQPQSPWAQGCSPRCPT